MKKALVVLIVLVMILQTIPVAAQGATAARPNSDPISSGTINKVTYLYWGKSEMYPTLALVGPNTKFDVYEYDKDWVMVLYDTWVSQGSGGSAQSFYCYVKRSDITCDPALEGDASDKADTGPGKKKGKKPKPQPSAGASAGGESAVPQDTPAESTEPEPTVETVDDEEYDWIIRTPGLCNVTVRYQEATFTCSFALMAQKAGGTAPSSDPTFNHGMHTPYAATGFFGMVAPMQDMLDNMGASSFLSGSGGIEISGQAPGTTFFIDTGAQDIALVNFTLNLDSEYALNPKITDGNLTGEFSMSGHQSYPLPVQLKKVGSGYKFVLAGMKPGGGDLEFPAVLEKTFADPNRWDKAAKDADKRRAEAEKLRKKMLEKLKKQMQDEYNKKQQDANKDGTSSTDPMTVKDDNGDDIPLAPLVTPEPDIPLAPLVTEDPNPPLATLGPVETPEIPLAPLVPSGDENVSSFPSHQP